MKCFKGLGDGVPRGEMHASVTIVKRDDEAGRMQRLLELSAPEVAVSVDFLRTAAAAGTAFCSAISGAFAWAIGLPIGDSLFINCSNSRTCLSVRYSPRYLDRKPAPATVAAAGAPRRKLMTS